MLQDARYDAVTRPILARLAPALLAVAATMLLGTIAPPFAQAWRWFESPALLPLVGIVFTGAAGLLACHLALQSVAPRPAWPAAALPAALVAAALPGLGIFGLLIPLGIGAHALLRWPALRVAALIGLGGVALALAAAWSHSPALHLTASLALLGAAALPIRRAARPAANDNDAAIFSTFWSLPDDAGCATQPPRTSSPFLGE